MTQAKHTAGADGTSKFTPGPWRLNPADKNEVIADSEWLVICRTQPALYQKCGPANAHLIAAAPEMYEALIEVLNMLEARPDILARVGVTEGLVLAKIAAAKAKADGAAT